MVEDRRARNSGRWFETVCTAADIRLLADVDEAFGEMSGQAHSKLDSGRDVPPAWPSAGLPRGWKYSADESRVPRVHGLVTTTGGRIRCELSICRPRS